MRGRNTYIKMKIRKLLGQKEEFFLGKRTHCRQVEFGYRCNIAYEADISNSKIGARTSIGRFTTVRDCVIGNFCAISWNCSLGAKNHPMGRVSGCGAFYHQRMGLIDKDIKEMEKAPITTIGNDVWIGCNVVICSGVTIGDGAIIGAGAIVTKDVEPYSVVVGMPAKHIKYRFDENIRKNLLESKWWLWSDKLLKENIELFQQELTEEISEKMREIGKKQMCGE